MATVAAGAPHRTQRPLSPARRPHPAPPISNRVRKELKFAVSSPESATSNFLIAVATQGKTPHCDPQSLERGAPNRHKITSLSAFSSFQPLASSLQNLIDTMAIRIALKLFTISTDSLSNRRKRGVFRHSMILHSCSRFTRNGWSVRGSFPGTQHLAPAIMGVRFRPSCEGGSRSAGRFAVTRGMA